MHYLHNQNHNIMIHLNREKISKLNLKTFTLFNFIFYSLNFEITIIISNKMKTLLLIMTIIISLSSFSLAQSQKKYKWGLSAAMNSIQAQIEIPLLTNTGAISTGSGAVLVDADGNIISRGNRIDNSFSWSIIPKYYIKEDILLRFDFGVTNLKLKADFDFDVIGNTNGNPSHAISHKEISTQIFRYTPGFQWFFLQEKKINSYCGMTVSYLNYKEVNVKIHQEIRYGITDTLSNWNNAEEITPGGFAVGIGACAGFNIFLYKHISLGAELSSYALYYKLGGEGTLDGTAQHLPAPVDTSNGVFTNSYKGFKISKIISSYNISFWF